MRGLSKFLALLTVSAGLAGCAVFGGAPPAAPQPAKPIDAARFFTGRWYEMARTPIGLTTNCVAGTTDFFTRPSGRLVELDECRMGSPEGHVKKFRGPIDMLDPGQNNEFVVHYILYGFIPFSVTYWILDRADDYSWFIVSDPSFQQIAILDRSPRPSDAEISALTARARALGYDTSKLEFPPHFPPGQG
jgi:apolipoprotein D and lipocalin family protein